MATLVQSARGAALAIGTTTAATYFTMACSFASPTSNGNTIVIPTWCYSTGNAGMGFNPLFLTLSTTLVFGFGYAARSTILNGTGTSELVGDVGIQYLTGCPPIQSFSMVCGIEPATSTASFAEFDLYEFAGPIPDPDFNLQPDLQSVILCTAVAGAPKTPQFRPITTAASDLIVANYLSPGLSATAGAGTGYTLGFNATLASGQFQYRSSLAAGVTTPSFGNSLSATNWGAALVALFLSSSTASAIAFSSQPQLIGF